MDIRTWSREMITDLINLYRNLPCLWKIKSDSYKNKKLRERAYAELVKFCRSRGFPEANRDFVVKKIQSLRGSFRKELKKVEASRKSGNAEEYEPSLWYYDLLLFTKDQELNDDLSYDENVTQFEDQSRESEHLETKDEVEVTELAETSTGSDPLYNWPNNDTEVELTPKKKKITDAVQTEYLSPCTECLKSNNRPVTEYEALGINIARKLEKMDELQAIYAESLINTVMRKGLLNKLKEESDICEGGCKLIVLQTPTLAHSKTVYKNEAE